MRAQSRSGWTLGRALFLAPLLLPALTPMAGAQESLRKLAIVDVAPIATSWPTLVAQEKGFFRARGLDVTVTYAGNAANVAQQVVAGSFELGATTFDTSMRAAASGAPIALIGATVTRYPVGVLVDSSVRDAKDLKGKTVILSFQKDVTTAIWNRWLREQGLDPKDVDQIYDGATPNRYAALASKAAQGAFLGAPFNFRAEREGYRTLVDFGVYAKDVAFLGVIGRRDWLAANGETARRYLAGLSDAIDWLYDPSNRDEAVEMLQRTTKQDRESLLKTHDYYINQLQAFSRKLAIPPGIVETESRLLVELGEIRSVSAVLLGFADASFQPK